MAKVTSSLSSAANKIVNINRSTSVMRNTQSSYSEFLRFMDIETKNLQAIKFDQKKLKKAYSANVTATFGSAGNLLSGLANGALDVGSLLGGMFGGKDKPSAKAGKPIPKGQKIRIPGVRGIGILAPLLAGLDFAQGVAGGESVGKAASGATGSAVGAAAGGAAGVALAGLIGQTLVPIPGLGFVLGAAVGGLGAFAGGYLGDRAYEGITGEGSAKEKTKAKLKQQEQKQRIQAASLTQLTFPQVLDKFDSVVVQFERSIQNIASGAPAETTDWEMGETAEDKVNYRPGDAEEFVPTGTGDGKEVFPLVGGRPNLTSEKDGGGFNSPRRGRKHNGQDIGVDPNTPVVSSRSGKVIDIYPTYGSAGSAVIVKYDNGQQGLYGHVNPSVKRGDRVEAGQKIARVTPDGGNTHLHYMRKDTKGNYIDPAPILRSSKSGTPISKVEPKKEKSTIGKDTGDSMVSQQTQMIPKSATTDSQKPTQDLSKMSTNQLKGMLDPTITGAANPAVFKAAQEARTRGEESGLSGESLEREVLIASIRAKNAEAQVMGTSQQPVVPQQLQQYPSYIMGQNTTTLIPIIQGSGGNQPMVISSGGGGAGSPGQTVVMSGPSEGQILNSLMKTILLTSLSAT